MSEAQQGMPAADAEAILDPARAIVDAHHHFWRLGEAQIARMEAGSLVARGQAISARLRPHYLFDDLQADIGSGHNIVATVFVDAYAMYRASGPAAMRSLGEVEFVNGIAAMGASGQFGLGRPCAGIVGNADLTLGAAVEDVLVAHLQAAPDRYRGVRIGAATAHDPDPSILGTDRPGLLADSAFRAGLTVLQRLGLSLDLFVLEPQLPELVDLAEAFPDLPIVLNHLGGILGIGAYAGRTDERFAIWDANMRRLAVCGNVTIKIGGLGMALAGLPSFAASPQAHSSQLAREWRPYVETAIETFGAQRCLFESNYPVDAATCSYASLWNAFKQIVGGASEDEQEALFSGTAIRTYRLALD